MANKSQNKKVLKELRNKGKAKLVNKELLSLTTCQA